MYDDPTRTILIVDDEPHALHILSRQLTHAGYIVLCARDGTEALQLLTDYRGPIDLLVTDVMMPGLDGVELGRRASVLHPGMQVVYLSGMSERALKSHGLDPERVSFLARPYSSEQLREVVEQLL